MYLHPNLSNDDLESQLVLVKHWCSVAVYAQSLSLKFHPSILYEIRQFFAPKFPHAFSFPLIKSFPENRISTFSYSFPKEAKKKLQNCANFSPSPFTFQTILNCCCPFVPAPTNMTRKPQ
jgi:hypothetical protein